jgi:hypothetical protein
MPPYCRPQRREGDIKRHTPDPAAQLFSDLPNHGTSPDILIKGTETIPRRRVIMAKAKKIKQLFFMVPDKAGQLAEVTTALASAKVNISNICAYGMQGEATFMMTTDSHAKAKKALAPFGAEIKEYDVVEVEMTNKPGELQKVAKKLGDADITSCTYMEHQLRAGPQTSSSPPRTMPGQSSLLIKNRIAHTFA